MHGCNICTVPSFVCYGNVTFRVDLRRRTWNVIILFRDANDGTANSVIEGICEDWLRLRDVGKSRLNQNMQSNSCS